MDEQGRPRGKNKKLHREEKRCENKKSRQHVSPLFQRVSVCLTSSLELPWGSPNLKCSFLSFHKLVYRSLIAKSYSLTQVLLLLGSELLAFLHFLMNYIASTNSRVCRSRQYHLITFKVGHLLLVINKQMKCSKQKLLCLLLWPFTSLLLLINFKIKVNKNYI